MVLVSSKHSFYKKNRKICLHGALKHFGVKKNSYAASIIERLYDYYCGSSHSLYLSYLKYYRKEFSNYRDFLERKFYMSQDEIDILKSWRLFYKDLSLQSERQIDTLLEDTNIKNAFKSFLEDVKK